MCYPIIIKRYMNIIKKEEALAGKDWSRLRNTLPSEIYNIAWRAMEAADLALLQRSYIERYHLAQEQVAWASVAAHTYIMETVLDSAINFCCDEDATYYTFGYSYRVLMEAARRHDLPELETGDIPDNGDRDDVAKNEEEREYHVRYRCLAPPREKEFEEKVKEVLAQMAAQSSLAGRLLYLADKISAIPETLAYDMAGLSPVKYWNDDDISNHDREIMSFCTCHGTGAYKASEVWTASYIKRGLTKMDDTGFFTAMMVMITLIANKGEWYGWREKDYESLS